MPEMIACLKLRNSCGDNYEEGLKKLCDLTENCPGCILAAIRQSGVQRKPEPIDGKGWIYDDGVYLSFDFKAEKESFWKEVNSIKDYDTGCF